MSQIQVTTLESNTVSANVITAGQTTVNSTGLYLNKSESEYSGVISTSSLIVSQSDLNYTLSAEFNNSSDSYTPINASITNFDTYIRLTATATDPTLTSPVFSYYGTQIGKIIIKIRRIAGSGWDGSIFYSTAGHGFSESFKFDPPEPAWVGTDWAYIQLDGSKLFAGGNDFITNTITRIRFDFGTTASDIFDIDYIRFYPVNILTSIVSVPSITINGTTYTSLVSETVNTQIFTANGTWSKPGWANTGNELVVVHMWGGGGGAGWSSGGGGGAFVFGYYKSSQLGATANVVVGLGGAAGGTLTNGSNGASSSIADSVGNLLVAYGGGGGGPNQGGSGGGWLGTGGPGAAGGGPLGGAAGTTGGDSTFGGGGGHTTSPFRGGRSIYGGGGGGDSTGGYCSSVFGGGGGGSGTAPGGDSIFGGKGGTGPTTSANIPGGGGSGDGNRVGARGEVRVYTYRILA